MSDAESKEVPRPPDSFRETVDIGTCGTTMLGQPLAQSTPPLRDLADKAAVAPSPSPERVTPAPELWSPDVSRVVVAEHDPPRIRDRNPETRSAPPIVRPGNCQHRRCTPDTTRMTSH